MSIVQTTLELLNPILPIRGVIHIGVGGPHNLKFYQALNVKHAILIEANHYRSQRLSEEASQKSGWLNLCELIGEKDGTEIYYETNNANEDGLIAPEKLQPLWQNLKTREQKKRQVLSLKSCLEKHGENINPDNFNLLNITCFPALAILKGAEELVEKMDVIIARALIDEKGETNVSTEMEETKERQILVNQMDVYLREKGLVKLTLESERHPAIAHHLYVRDYKTRCKTLEIHWQQKWEDQSRGYENRIAALQKTYEQEVIRLEANLESQSINHETNVSEIFIKRSEEKQPTEHTHFKNEDPVNLTSLKRLRSLNSTTRNNCMYLEVKSLPRSGIHYMKSSFEYVLGSTFSFCEWYQEPGCCRNHPCDLTCFLESKKTPTIRMVKSHDFNLSDPTYEPKPPLKRLVLIRDPLFILTSWWSLEMLTKNSEILENHGIKADKINYLHEHPVLAKAYSLIDSYGKTHDETELIEWLELKKIYIQKFIEKWCDPSKPHGKIVSYEKVKKEIRHILKPYQRRMNKTSLKALGKYNNDKYLTFQPRNNAFSSKSNRLSDALQEHSELFQTISDDIRKSIKIGRLSIY